LVGPLFGRTPRISYAEGGPGRPLAAACRCAVRRRPEMGQASAPLCPAVERPSERPLTAHDLWVTVFRHLGIDPNADVSTPDPKRAAAAAAGRRQPTPSVWTRQRNRRRRRFNRVSPRKRSRRDRHVASGAVLASVCWPFDAPSPWAQRPGPGDPQAHLRRLSAWSRARLRRGRRQAPHGRDALRPPEWTADFRGQVVRLERLKRRRRPVRPGAAPVSTTWT